MLGGWACRQQRVFRALEVLNIFGNLMSDFLCLGNEATNKKMDT